MPRSRVFICATQADGVDARSLQRALRRFRIPKTLNIEPGRRKFLKSAFWGHEDEQPRVQLVPETVLAPIRGSEAMIVVCTPAASLSKWVRMEIAAFVEAKPWAPVVAVVRAGEPHPERAADAFVRPCFPPNLPAEAVKKWIDARHSDWEEIAAPGVLSLLLGKRPEQFAHHAMLGSGDLKRQRRFAIAGALAGILAAVWIVREPLHELAIEQVPGYAENIAPRVQSWIPSRPAEHVSEIEIVESDPFAAALSQNPEGLRAALGAWLNAAELVVDEHPEQAKRWTNLARQALESPGSEGADFGFERYRFHALSAVLAKNTGENAAAQTHLETAIGAWTALPFEDVWVREGEAFTMLESISADPIFSGSAQQLLDWICKLKGEESTVLERAGRLAELAGDRPDFAESIENALARLPDSIDPPSPQPAFARAWLSSIRSRLASDRGERERSAHLLSEAIDDLGEAPDSPEKNAIRARLGLELLNVEDLSDNAVVAGRLDEIVPALEAAALQSPSLAEDAFQALDWRGDLHLAAGEDEEAARLFERALAHAPEPALVETLIKTGIAFHYAGDNVSAEQAFIAVTDASGEPEVSANRLTAVRGSILVAQALGQTEVVELLAENAADLARQLPDYEPPPYWRDPAAKLRPSLPAEIAAEEPELESEAEPEPASTEDSKLATEIAALRKKIIALEAEQAIRANFVQTKELRGLYAELDRLDRERLSNGEQP